MKNVIYFFLFFASFCKAQDLDGSWRLEQVNGSPVEGIEKIKIYEDGYFTWGSKEATSDDFIDAGGGTYSLGPAYVERYDFHTARPEKVGQKISQHYKLNGDVLELTKENGESELWKRISTSKNDLAGNWVITGRKTRDQLQELIPGDRRTIKILGGNRFQWAAFNSATGEFFGTGGGTYTADKGVYVENIEFFSRDNDRVGAVLEFDYRLEDGQWHHSGKSSKGDPIYEIWSHYQSAYPQSK